MKTNHLFTIIIVFALSSFFFLSCVPDKDASIGKWTLKHCDDSDFIVQARQLIDSMAVSRPQALESSVREMADVLCGQGKDNLAGSLAGYLHGIDLPADEYSQIGSRLLTQLRLAGNPAPALPARKIRAKAGTIVLFYESHCPSCHIITEELISNYRVLNGQGVAIVSISADSHRQTYRDFAGGLPWEDKYCDYESFNGQYFKNWGVASTPTIYYVDAEGYVIGRYYDLEQIKQVVNL